MADSSSAEISEEQQFSSIMVAPCGIDMGSYGYRLAASTADYEMNSVSEMLITPMCDDTHVKRLLGRKFSDPELQSELPSFPFWVTEGPDGFPLVHCNFGGTYRAVSPTETVNCSLSVNRFHMMIRLKNRLVSDCCIGIPVHFTYQQRKELFSAATVACLRPRRLLHETTAAAINYRVHFIKLPEDGKFLNIAFIDVGYNSLQVSIVEFKHDQLKVLSHAYDKSLGGKGFDQVLFKHFSTQLKVNTGQESHGSLINLRRSCAILKEELSEKTEANLHVENMSDNHVMNRVEFEKLSSTLLERVKVVLQKALNEAKIAVENIDSVEVLGNGSRMPAIINMLKVFFGKEPKQTMLECSAVVAGCLFECNSLCLGQLTEEPGIPKFQVIDILPYSIRLQWKLVDGTRKDLTVFSKGSPLPSVKDVIFRQAKRSFLYVYIKYQDSENVSLISSYMVDSSRCSEDQPVEVKVRVQLNVSGFFYVESATVGENIIPVSEIFCGKIEAEHLQNSTHLKPEFFLSDLGHKSNMEISDISMQLETIKHSLSEETKQRIEVEKIIQDERREQKHMEEISNEHMSALERQIEEFKGLLETTKKQHEEMQIGIDEAVKEKDGALKQVELYKKLVNFTEFSVSELKEATNNFDESCKIGEGGFASVYKGFLRHTNVAIKKLNPEKYLETIEIEFNQEVEILTNVRHPNLISLIGSSREARALIYEFLPNDSLDKYITNGKDPCRKLSWQNRIRIASEICSALIFLHSIPPSGIAHGDIKPENILLDSNFVCKIIDFGISRKLQLTEKTLTPLHLTEYPKFTPAYGDPEFFASSKLTPQSDTYSFGIILLQLVTSRGPYMITEFVEGTLETGKLDNLVDGSVCKWPIEKAKMLAKLAIRCCDPKRRNRPDLAKEVWPSIESMKQVAGPSIRRSTARAGWQ